MQFLNGAFDEVLRAMFARESGRSVEAVTMKDIVTEQARRRAARKETERLIREEFCHWRGKQLKDAQRIL